MEEKVIRELDRLLSEMKSCGFSHLPEGTVLVGTAGTATTLAALDLEMHVYDRDLVQGHELTLLAVRKLYRAMHALTPAQRLLVPGMEKGREDLVIAGMLIVLKTMEMFGFERCTVSDSGLLEGLLISMR